ncbi:hypothetical protein RJ641_019039 [Dillenia turbinata]|uniref:Uncharacterized protein n=1 Tax=Dillenia turbinata TaxID=194707 RepID=A0AAN8UG66_9MAGN
MHDIENETEKFTCKSRDDFKSPIDSQWGKMGQNVNTGNNVVTGEALEPVIIGNSVVTIEALELVSKTWQCGFLSVVIVELVFILGPGGVGG